MENMQYADELVKEFLIFRGFTSTLQAFERELGTDIGKGFHVDKILELIFSVYISQFRAEDLIKTSKSSISKEFSRPVTLQQRKIDQLSEERSRQVPGSKSIESQQEEERR
ncbi:hypothetical protein ACSBR1_026579 [Camellia fascicularis]